MYLLYIPRNNEYDDQISKIETNKNGKSMTAFFAI